MKLFLLLSLFIAGLNARSFGYNKDVKFANMLWNEMKHMRLVGDQTIFTHPYKGLPPHGTYVERIESKLRVGRTRGHVIILKNYISSNINLIHILNNPSSYLKNISVMFKRKNNYDRDNKNWFYAQYNASGVVMKSTQGVRLAGKIAKGSQRGCISCHSSAPEHDYIFSHDKLSSLVEEKMYEIKNNTNMTLSVKKNTNMDMKKSIPKQPMYKEPMMKNETMQQELMSKEPMPKQPMNPMNQKSQQPMNNKGSKI